jgi:tripartite-type tricarboxylate transporter receptor subunit TctC
MKLGRREFLYLAGLAGAAAALPDNGRAQGYPNKPIRIIVPFAAGGPTDVVARIVGAKVSESLGQQVIIENVLGASGNIGTRNVARAAPDGYTLLVTASGFVVNPSLYASSPYDAIKDFAPITVAASAPNVLITHPSLEVKTVKELVELIRANPGKHNFASAGVGQTGHLAGELMKTSYKLDLTHVPFNGGAPIMNSMMGGHTLIAFLSLPSAAAFIRDNRVRGLAVTSPKRSSAVPDVPTAAEAGFPELETEFFQGVLAPAGTPKQIIDRWHAEIVKAMQQPDVQKKLAGMSFEAQPNTPDQFAAMIKAEVAKWAGVIRDAKIPQVQ